MKNLTCGISNINTYVCKNEIPSSINSRLKCHGVFYNV